MKMTWARKISRLISGVTLLMVMSSQMLLAETSPSDGSLKQRLMQFEQEFQEWRALQSQPDMNMVGEIKFVFGNNIWQPGRQFKNGEDWLALACTIQGCGFEAAVLSVKRMSWQDHYDNSATAGQQLHFRPLVPSKRKIIAWFNTRSAPMRLKPGNIPTYYPGVGRPKQTGKGTLEALIELPGGDTASLIPMLLSAKHSPDLIGDRHDRSLSFFLQLRSRGKRQLLLGNLGQCSQSVDNQGYLLWAGDLDSDGKPDYLVSFIDADGPVHLYLSSAAKSGELVGLVGVHYAPPYDGEC